MTTRARKEPMKNWAYSQFSMYAMAGTEIMVTALISVATKDRQAAHQGIFLPPRKKSLVDFSSRPK